MVVRMVRALPFQMALRIRKPRLGFAGTATASCSKRSAGRSCESCTVRL